MTGWAEGGAVCATVRRGAMSGRLRVSTGAVVVLSGLFGQAGVAAAQTFSTFITPMVAPDYSRDRNVSVQEEAHPDYDALGVGSAGVTVYPSITAGVGATNNTYNNDSNKRGSVFTVLQPSVFARSNWSRNRVSVQLSDDSRRYLGETPRNQDSWYADVAGQVDVSDQLAVKMDVQAARFFESPFSSDASASDEVLSNYLRKYAGLDVVWSEGRVRLTGGYNRASLNFSTLHYTNGTSVNQAYRDRLYNVKYLRSEYALSPSISVYGQASFDKVTYDQASNFGQPARNSDGQQLIGGLSFDLSGILRGNVGVGFTHRSFDSALYADVSGFSAQAKVDFFVTPLTTLTVSGQRTLQDSSLGTASAFWDTRAQVQVDHSVRENIIVSPQMQYVRQSFVGLNQSRSYFASGLSGRVQFNRRLGVRANVGYAHASGLGSGGASPFTEVTGTLSVQYRI